MVYSTYGRAYTNTCVAFGIFDGVHKGHDALLKYMQQVKGDLESIVLTFDPVGLSPEDGLLLSTAVEKRRLLENYPLDHHITFPMNVKTFDVTPEEFIEKVLINTFGAKRVVAASNCSFFGGGIKQLREGAEKWGFEVCELEPIEGVSDTEILKALDDNRIDKAIDLLGHSYLIMGEVVHGKALGRTVGMPTANISYPSNKRLPNHGVYGTISEIDGRLVMGLTNIGKRPSVDSFDYVTIEAFLLDFDGDLYGQTINLDVHVLIRGVQKFSGLDEVKAQVSRDTVAIRGHLEKIVKESVQ